MKVIITGVTGYVGQGVLLESLKNEHIREVLAVTRNPLLIRHPKLKELIVADFMNLEPHVDSLKKYDACFYCAGISANGLNEQQYTHITFDVTMRFAAMLSNINPLSTFIYISGQLSDSSEKGRMMWARVKGKTENALSKLLFRNVYSLRPGLMRPAEGQKRVKLAYKMMLLLFTPFNRLFPGILVSLKDVTTAMVNCVIRQPFIKILEAKDIKTLAKNL